MSSDLFVDDGSFYRHSYEADLQLFSEPFSPFSDSAIDILQAISDHESQKNPQNPVDDQPHSFEQTSPHLISSSPPSYQLESLSLYQATHLSPLQNGPNLGNFSALDPLEVKTEQCHVGFDQNAYNYNNQQPFAPHSYEGGAENVAKYMQRSYSSNSFDGKPGFLFQPRFDSVMENPNFQNQAASLSSPESSFLTSHMRRVSSTGDLQVSLKVNIFFNEIPCFFFLFSFSFYQILNKTALFRFFFPEFENSSYSSRELGHGGSWELQDGEVQCRREEREDFKVPSQEVTEKLQQDH